MNQAKRPLGITIVSILTWAAAILAFFQGLQHFGVISGFFVGEANVIFGSILILFGILRLIAGVGLWALTNWGRRTALILYFLGLGMALLQIMDTNTLVLGIFSFAIGVSVLAYLFFSSSMTEAFA